MRELGTGWIHFLPIVGRGPDGRVTAESVSAEAYGRFLCAVFDQWVQHDLGRLNVQFFAEVMNTWAGGTPNLCWMAPTCGRVLVVEHDGAVYSCDHFVNPEHRFGNLEGAQLGALVDLPVQQRFGAAKSDGLPSRCRACPWLAACNGGSPKDRFALTEDGEPGLNYLFDGLRRFFAHAEQPSRRVIERLRRKARPELVMAEMRGESAARWRGVGRNDPCPCGSGLKAKACCWELRP